MVDSLQIAERSSHCLRDYRHRVKDSNKSPPRARLVLALSTLPAAIRVKRLHGSVKELSGGLNNSLVGKTNAANKEA